MSGKGGVDKARPAQGTRGVSKQASKRVIEREAKEPEEDLKEFYSTTTKQQQQQQVPRTLEVEKLLRINRITGLVVLAAIVADARRSSLLQQAGLLVVL